MRQRVSLNFNWASQPMSPRICVWSLGMASLGRGGKMYCLAWTCMGSFSYLSNTVVGISPIPFFVAGEAGGLICER